MAQLDKLKIRLPDASDALLAQLLEDSQGEILDHCHLDALTTSMEGLQRELAIVYYNRAGTEGETSRSEGGISVSYDTDIPAPIKRRLNTYRAIRW
jgi:hypothetical protein